jgi:hypothetical protein
MYMGSNPRQYLFEEWGRWWFRDIGGETVGPYPDYAAVLKDWKQHVRVDVQHEPSLLDRLQLWWQGGK